MTTRKNEERWKGKRNREGGEESRGTGAEKGKRKEGEDGGY